MTRRARIILTVGLACALVITALAPFALMLLPNPKPVAVTDIASQPPGNYIATGSRTYHVFPRAEKVAEFPSDSLTAAPDAVFVVKYRQLADLAAYKLWSFDTQSEVPIRYDVGTPKLLRLRPVSPLPAGRYVTGVARESIYGGEDYVYFSVGRRGGQR